LRFYALLRERREKEYSVELYTSWFAKINAILHFYKLVVHATKRLNP
jgi:hypothetical protein